MTTLRVAAATIAVAVIVTLAGVAPAAAHSGGGRPPPIQIARGLIRGGVELGPAVAYTNAGERVRARSSCRQFPTSVLAAIGWVETRHGTYGGSRVNSRGVVTPSIFGIRLDGRLAGTAVIRDSDNGRWDRDTRFDRAVGPMQFIPSTWRSVAANYNVDASGDGIENPQNIHDATLAAAHYLCDAARRSGRPIHTTAGITAALRSYNPSSAYRNAVLRRAAYYRSLY